MGKKRISGQTIAIIILAIALILSIGFGGVYAFYSAKSNKVIGEIKMATLNISMVSGASDKSEIAISNGVNIVPGQQLENSPLIINNSSSAKIYLAVVYRIVASKTVEDEEIIVIDNCETPVLGLGVEYINSIFQDESLNQNVTNRDWLDYVFKADVNDSNAQLINLGENEQGEEQTCRGYRCLISTKAYNPPAQGVEFDPITVIGENKLSLSGAMGNDYQNSSIIFTFQAYAIGAESFSLDEISNAQRCETIIKGIYQHQDMKLLNINI